MKNGGSQAPAADAAALVKGAAANRYTKARFDAIWRYAAIRPTGFSIKVLPERGSVPPRAGSRSVANATKARTIPGTAATSNAGRQPVRRHPAADQEDHQASHGIAQ